MLTIRKEVTLSFIRHMNHYLGEYIDNLKSALDECTGELNNYEEDSDLFKQAYAFGLTVYNTFNDYLRNPALNPELLSADALFNFMVTITAFHFSGLKLDLAAKQSLTDIKASKVVGAASMLSYMSLDLQGEFAELLYGELRKSKE